MSPQLTLLHKTTKIKRGKRLNGDISTKIWTETGQRREREIWKGYRGRGRDTKVHTNINYKDREETITYLKLKI